MTKSFEHIPVMMREVEGLLALKPGSIYVDCTLGFGGHAAQASRLIGPEGRVIGIDQDEDAIRHARASLAETPARIDIVKANFSEIDQVLAGLGIDRVDAILMDLGVSSLQFDDPSRGFTFREDAPLDMRMDRQAATTAADLVNTLSEEELADLIGRLGEERFCRRIAFNIVRARAARPLQTTGELANLILRSLPQGYQRGKLHPATRTFQALRIAVNRELDVLQEVLIKGFERLRIGGRMAIIAFHSLEDRIVKENFRALARSGRATLLTKKPLQPGREEIVSNSRSRSARLRALERI